MLALMGEKKLAIEATRTMNRFSQAVNTVLGAWLGWELPSSTSAGKEGRFEDASSCARGAGVSIGFSVCSCCKAAGLIEGRIY